VDIFEIFSKMYKMSKVPNIFNVSDMYAIFIFLLKNIFINRTLPISKLFCAFCGAFPIIVIRTSDENGAMM